MITIILNLNKPIDLSPDVTTDILCFQAEDYGEIRDGFYCVRERDGKRRRIPVNLINLITEVEMELPMP